MRPGFWQILIIVALIAILFGAQKIPELARSLGAEDKLRVSCDRFGNSSSASVPVTIATSGLPRPSTLLLAGFGAGLSASAAYVRL